VKRGTGVKLTVMGLHDEGVTAAVQYRRGKPVIYRGKVGSSGLYVKAWKVPKLAPLGAAHVKVTVDGPESSQPTTLDFVVLR
jgi:hypothetical protein